MFLPTATSNAIIIGSTKTVGGIIGSVLFVDSSNNINQNNANLFWDNTNNRLGIGTTSPGAKLAINAGGSNPVYIGQAGDNANYNIVSLNGTLSSPGHIGLEGGGTGDGNLYIDSTDGFIFRPNNSSTAKFTVLSTGNIVAPGGQMIFAGGTSVVAGQVFTIGQNTTYSSTGASQAALVMNGLFGTAATTYGIDGYFRLGTATASFTMASGYGLYVDAPSIGSGSTVTTQYGERILNQGVSGSTTAYGLYVDAQSGATSNYAAVFAGGNVGIGTTTPAAPLSVGSTSQFQVDSSGRTFGPAGAAVAGQLTYSFTGDTDTGIYNSFANALTIVAGGANMVKIDLTGFHFTAGPSRMYLSSDVRSLTWEGSNQTGIAIYGSGATAHLTFDTNSATKLILTNTGLLGVGYDGAAPPSYRLDVLETTTTLTRGLNVSHTGAITGTGYGGYFSKTGVSTTNIGLYATATGATNNYAAIFEAGNVGIGTTAPSRLLHVGGRMQLGGTAIATTDWALTSGWGANATISAVTGTDSRGTVTVQTSALDTPLGNPVITLTFKDGTWTSIPFAVATMNRLGTGLVGAAECNTTATTLVLEFAGTPTALTAATYIFNYYVIG